MVSVGVRNGVSAPKSMSMFKNNCLSAGELSHSVPYTAYMCYSQNWANSKSIYSPFISWLCVFHLCSILYFNVGYKHEFMKENSQDSLMIVP